MTPLGHTPSTAGTLRKKFRKNSGKTPETLSERFLEFPSRVRLACPKPYKSRHLRLPERFQNSLPPSTAGGRFFFQNWFRRGPLRAGHGIPSSTGGLSDPLVCALNLLPDYLKGNSLLFSERGSEAALTQHRSTKISRFWRLWSTPCPPFAGPANYRTKRQP